MLRHKLIVEKPVPIKLPHNQRSQGYRRALMASQRHAKRYERWAYLHTPSSKLSAAPVADIALEPYEPGYFETVDIEEDAFANSHSYEYGCDAPMVNHVPFGCAPTLPFHSAYNSATQPAGSRQSVARDFIPKNFEQSQRCPEGPEWNKATLSEIGSLHDKHTFKTEPLDISSINPKHILPSKLVFDKRYNPDGSFKKFKVRLCIRGDFWQDSGIPSDTYAATVKSESVRMILAMAAELDLNLQSIDVSTAFLYPDLKPEHKVYMRRPTGLTDAHLPYITELQKALYGLPIASAYFRRHSDQVLRNIGFVPTISDACVYRLTRGTEYIYALVHVDDIGLASSSLELSAEIIRLISLTYEITINEDMSFFLGLNITRDRSARTLYIRQTQYIKDMFDHYGYQFTDDQSFPPTT